MTPMPICRWCGTYVAMIWHLCSDDMLIGNALETYVPMYKFLNVHSHVGKFITFPHVPSWELMFPCWRTLCVPTWEPHVSSPKKIVPLLGNIECSKLRFSYSHVPNMCVPMLVILNGNMGTKELQLDNVLFSHKNMCSCMFPNMVYSDCILFSMFRKLYWMYLIFLWICYIFVWFYCVTEGVASKDWPKVSRLYFVQEKIEPSKMKMIEGLYEEMGQHHGQILTWITQFLSRMRCLRW